MGFLSKTFGNTMQQQMMQPAVGMPQQQMPKMQQDIARPPMNLVNGDDLRRRQEIQPIQNMRARPPQDLYIHRGGNQGGLGGNQGGIGSFPNPFGGFMGGGRGNFMRPQPPMYGGGFGGFGMQPPMFGGGMGYGRPPMFGGGMYGSGGMYGGGFGMQPPMFGGGYGGGFGSPFGQSFYGGIGGMFPGMGGGYGMQRPPSYGGFGGGYNRPMPQPIRPMPRPVRPQPMQMIREETKGPESLMRQRGGPVPLAQRQMAYPF